MTCNRCVQHVTSAIQAVSGVVRVEVDLKAGRATVDHGDADRGADIDVVTADRIGRANRGNDAPGDRLQRIRVGGAGGDDGEFVAAEPGDQIVTTHDAGEPLGDG